MITKLWLRLNYTDSSGVPLSYNPNVTAAHNLYCYSCYTYLNDDHTATFKVTRLS